MKTSYWIRSMTEDEHLYGLLLDSLALLEEEDSAKVTFILGVLFAMLEESETDRVLVMIESIAPNIDVNIAKVLKCFYYYYLMLYDVYNEEFNLKDIKIHNFFDKQTMGYMKNEQFSVGCVYLEGMFFQKHNWDYLGFISGLMNKVAIGPMFRGWDILRDENARIELLPIYYKLNGGN